MTDDLLTTLLTPGPEGAPHAVLSRAARALLDLPSIPQTTEAPPPWLAVHQRPAATRLTAILSRYGGAVLGDAPGLGKSYVTMAVALMRREPFTLVVPAVLVDQWKRLCRRFEATPEILTHEALSRHRACRRDMKSLKDKRGLGDCPMNGPARGLLVVDEAHHFRNPATKRYRALAELSLGARVLLITATPVHNHIGDLVHLLRLFLRDDALAGLGIPSLKRAAAGERWAALPAALAHLVVARSRSRAPSLALPVRARGKGVRVGPAPPDRLRELVSGIEKCSEGPAGALVRMVLLTRLASSLPAFRESVSRQEAFADVSAEAGQSGRALTRRDFQRVFPRGEEPDLQLALLPLVLPPGDGRRDAGDRDALRHLRELSTGLPDPKASRLDRLLSRHPARTIVFTSSRATARYLQRTLQRRHRVAAVMGARGVLPSGPAPVSEVLALFAPVATGVAPPPEALSIDVLIATDLASEGLNLQDASRVIHYDLPWTAARLSQRVGRIDRLGSAHPRVQVLTFLPPAPLADAIRMEARLLVKARVGRRAGLFDWCDRLQALVNEDDACLCAVSGREAAVLLVVSTGGTAEPFIVRESGVTADPRVACELLEDAAAAPAVPVDGASKAFLRSAICRASPLIRKRLDQLESARWRAGDRDQLSRRLIPMVIREARRAAREGNAPRVTELDAVIERLGSGMTAGEELSLARLAERPAPLTVDSLCRWSERLPASGCRLPAPELQLVAAVLVVR
ncbi:MAG TPA: DEAD/DEAH box helicase [Gemmatimonadales bacterium]|nr:DEAD/DEAH box helicase [Gemmatimonadales bacterium]